MVQIKKTVSFFLFVVFGTFLMRTEVFAGTAFDKVIAQVEELEQIAEEYVETTGGVDAKRLTISYLISDRYQGGLWEKVAIQRNEDFAAYVKEQDASLEDLKQITTLQVPAGYEVDFLHMAASMYVGDDAGGWIGDLTEFAYELKQSGIEDKEGAEERFLGQEGYFNSADFYADIDAANMTRTYAGNSLSETLKEYYVKEAVTEEESLYRFVEAKFSADTKEELERAVSYTYQSHWLVQELYNAIGLDQNADQSYILLAANTFADYLYEQTEERIRQEENTEQVSILENTIEAEEAKNAKEAAEAKNTTEIGENHVITEINDTDHGSWLFGVALIFIILTLCFLACKKCRE